MIGRPTRVTDYCRPLSIRIFSRLADMSRQLIVAALISAALISAGVVAVIAPLVGASGEQFYVSCTQRGVEEKPEPKSHPRNCVTAAASVHKHSAALLRLDFQQISWHSWGSTTAQAVAKAVKSHVSRKVHFSLTGRQVCKGLTYYARIVMEGPKRLYPHKPSFDLACGSVPEE